MANHKKNPSDLRDQRLSILTTQDRVDALKRLAKEQSRTMSYLVDEAIRVFLPTNKQAVGGSRK